MRVCKEWFEVIEEHKSMWRRVRLPKRELGWNTSHLELFDRKSQSSLVEVSMDVNLTYEPSNDLFMETLEKSKGTLRTIHFTTSKNYYDVQDLSDLSWRLPSITDFRVTKSDLEQVILIMPEVQTNLKVLWIGWSPVLFRSHLFLLGNLSSLNLDFWINGDNDSSVRQILETPSATLKHLKLSFVDVQEFPPLDFPILQVLQIQYRNGLGQPGYPSWLRIPTSSTLIIHGEIPTSVELPSISKLRVDHSLSCLANRSPLLTELRIMKKVGYGSFYGLIKTLRQRKSNADTFKEVDGVRMIPLRCLVVELGRHDPVQELKRLVDTIVDPKTVSKFIEIEV